MLYSCRWKGSSLEDNLWVQVGSILCTFLRKKKVSLFQITAESLLQNSLLYLHLLALILLFTLQTLNPPFPDLLLPSTEDLCPLYHRYSALAKGLLFQTRLLAPLCGNLPIICHQPVNWALSALLEERGRFYTQQKRS